MFEGFIEWIRSLFGAHPVMALFILGLSLTASLIYTIIQLILVDINKVKIYGERIRKWREKYRRAMRTGDPRLLSEVQRESDIINRLQLELSKETMKPMLASFLMFLVIFWIITASFDARVAVILPFKSPVTWFGPVNYTEYDGQYLSGLSAFWWYVLTSISFSSLINICLKITGRRPY